MATVNYIDPIASISGRLSKKQKRGGILRQKLYRDECGHVVAEGALEAYCVLHPRDYDKNPPKGAELRTITLFQQAALQAAEERRDPERLAYWQERFAAQLRHGDAEAPIDPYTGRPRIYCRFHIFVQSILYQRLKSQTPDQTTDKDEP